MTLPFVGQVDALVIAALGFLALVLVVTAWLFAWVNGQMRKQRGQR